MSKNLIVDNLIKFSLPRTWNHNKNQPNERVLSFLASIINTHISIFIIQVFRRNLVETNPVVDNDGNSKNDRYRASKMKVNEEHVFTCTRDIHQLVDRLFEPYKNEISQEEIEYYRRNMKPNALQEQLIEIYFFNYTGSSQEFKLLRNYDWYRMLLIMRNDIMRRMGITKDMLLDSTLPLLLTANIEETPVGEKLYVKDTKYLKDDPEYNALVDKYYSTVVDMNEDIIKKFLITFVNSKYRFVIYEEQGLLGQEISINKRELMSQVLNFLILSNESITLEDMLTE